MPRVVKFKPRTSRHPEFVPNGVRLNRTYDDYQVCLDEHPGSNVVEMDAVIGRIGGKVIMTLQFVNVDFVFGLLLENKSAAEAAAKISSLKKKLAEHVTAFGDVFPILRLCSRFSVRKARRSFPERLAAAVGKISIMSAVKTREAGIIQKISATACFVSVLSEAFLPAVPRSLHFLYSATMYLSMMDWTVPSAMSSSSAALKSA